MNQFIFNNSTDQEKLQHVIDALSISLLDAGYPSPETVALTQQYIDGKIDYEDLRNKIIEIYKPY